MPHNRGRHLERSEGSLYFAAVTGFASLALLAGCKSAPPPVSAPAGTPAQSAAPVRPTIPAPPFKLFHQTDNSLTLVTDEHATDEQIEALLWQLHDAAQTSTFDKLKLPQRFIDQRDPMIWFHIYRGPKCASEKYAAKLPCGASYHAAGDYTLGSFKDRNHDDGIVIHDDNHETHLWPTS